MSKAKGWPDLSRTKAAIEAYDEADAVDAASLPLEEWAAHISRVEALGAEVGKAFGLDTADRNNPETCARHVRPGPKNPRNPADLSFVRCCVRDWEASKR